MSRHLPETTDFHKALMTATGGGIWVGRDKEGELTLQSTTSYALKFNLV